MYGQLSDAGSAPSSAHQRRAVHAGRLSVDSARTDRPPALLCQAQRRCSISRCQTRWQCSRNGTTTMSSATGRARPPHRPCACWRPTSDASLRTRRAHELRGRRECLRGPQSLRDPPRHPPHARSIAVLVAYEAARRRRSHAPPRRHFHDRARRRRVASCTRASSAIAGRRPRRVTARAALVARQHTSKKRARRPPRRRAGRRVVAGSIRWPST